MLNTPWSYVGRFKTSKGYIYLKQTPELLALEAPLTQVLHDKYKANVPEVIAHNTQLRCFLMKDAGNPLRERLKKKFDKDLLCKTIEQLSALQINVSDSINIFLKLGVPDWRLDKIPSLYKRLIRENDILLEDGLIEVEIVKLMRLLPKVKILCEKLSGYSVKQTLVQCDFHDNNVLIEEKTKVLTFIDLGGIVVSHPFFSLIGCLRQANKHHGLKINKDVYQDLINSCFKNYINEISNVIFFEAFRVAEILWVIYDALAQYRLRLACDKEMFLSFQQHGKLASSLKELINILD